MKNKMMTKDDAFREWDKRESKIQRAAAVELCMIADKRRRLEISDYDAIMDMHAAIEKYLKKSQDNQRRLDDAWLFLN